MSGGPTGSCGDCHAAVLWVRLETGGTMPADPAVDEAGTVAAHRDATGRWVGRVLRDGENPDPGERRYVTHFATCRVKLARAAATQARRAAGVGVVETRQRPTPPDNVTLIADYRGRASGPTGGLGLPRGR